MVRFNCRTCEWLRYECNANLVCFIHSLYYTQRVVSFIALPIRSYPLLQFTFVLLSDAQSTHVSHTRANVNFYLFFVLELDRVSASERANDRDFLVKYTMKMKKGKLISHQQCARQLFIDETVKFGQNACTIWWSFYVQRSFVYKQSTTDWDVWRMSRSLRSHESSSDFVEMFLFFGRAIDWIRCCCAANNYFSHSHVSTYQKNIKFPISVAFDCTFLLF